VKISQSTKPHFDLIPDVVLSQLFGLYAPDTFLGARNLAMLSDTGLRREEVVNVFHIERSLSLPLTYNAVMCFARVRSGGEPGAALRSHPSV